MAVPENVQQFAVRYTGGVVRYPYCLGMVAKLIVRRVYLGASGITDYGADNSLNTPEPGVRTPESAQGKGGRFRNGRALNIYGRNLLFILHYCFSFLTGAYQRH